MAAEEYRRVIDRWGSRFGLLVQYGNALKDAGAYADAADIYARAIAARPDDADVHLQRGHLAKLSNDFAMAEQLYRDALRLDPNLIDAARELETLSVSKSQGRYAASRCDEAWHLHSPNMTLPANLVYRRLQNQHGWRRA